MRYHRTNNRTRSDAAGRPLPPPFTWSLRDLSHICSAESLAYRHEQLGYLALRVPECNTVIFQRYLLTESIIEAELTSRFV